MEYQCRYKYIYTVEHLIICIKSIEIKNNGEIASRKIGRKLCKVVIISHSNVTINMYGKH